MDQDDERRPFGGKVLGGDVSGLDSSREGDGDTDALPASAAVVIALEEHREGSQRESDGKER